MPLDALEARVADHIAAREDDLVALLQRLVRFDSVESGGQLAALQGILHDDDGVHEGGWLGGAVVAQRALGLIERSPIRRLSVDLTLGG